MMEYSKSYPLLKSIFDPGTEEIVIPETKVRIHNLLFHSDFPADDFINIQDPLITENSTFSYPVFTPPSSSNKVILLLHGLNERSWVKYLAWACWLAENTSSYVILFPISFHINRSPESWKDPRAMVPYLNTRNSSLGKTSMLSFANVALSSRLTEDPIRFFNSGYQTTIDLIKLIKKVKSGHHEIIPAGCTMNVFAYSIGAFLAEIIMMANPENLFSESRLFIFCGGSVFSNMNGTSKLIMDSHAFNKVYNYYLYDFEESIASKSKLSEFIKSTRIGTAFRSMIDRGRLISFRENNLKRLQDQIFCVVLQKDTVIPVKGVVDTFKDSGKNNIINVYDFPFAYSHENPFPLFSSGYTDEVDRSFEMVFEKAGKFLA
jgi:hypothetical protein